MSNCGYIYVREHAAYAAHGCCKLGKSSNLKDRDSQYATGEIVRGHFSLVLCMSADHADVIERVLQRYFTCLGYHVQQSGGTEFYKLDIVGQIVSFMHQTIVPFRVVSAAELAELVKLAKLTEPTRRNLLARLCNIPAGYVWPRADQTEIISAALAYFQEHAKGLLVLTCGVGKTLISLWVAQRRRAKTILVGVPTEMLMHQWRDAVSKIFADLPVLCVCSGVSADAIRAFMQQHDACAIIVIYASAHKLAPVPDRAAFTFDFAILDEAHHLTSRGGMCAADIRSYDHIRSYAADIRSYVCILAVAAEKQLALTATMKTIDRADGPAISNDSVPYFGGIIARRGLLWAINAGIVCDYSIQTIVVDRGEFARVDISGAGEQRLYLSVVAALKSILGGHSHHMLIYTNNMVNCHIVMRYLRELCGNTGNAGNTTNTGNTANTDIYYATYTSAQDKSEQDEIIREFKAARCGIIVCVYCLGEGWDFPILDAVVFAEPMSSRIRIVQSALRASRKNIAESGKIAKIILPVINDAGWLDNHENADLKNIKDVVYQMGLEDVTIGQKITVHRMKLAERPGDYCDRGVHGVPPEYDAELTRLIVLRTMHRAAIGVTYETARRIVAENNVRGRDDYERLCERDNRLSKEPDVAFLGEFTTWVDYLGIAGAYYDQRVCRQKIAEYLPGIRLGGCIHPTAACAALCQLDANFPPDGMWADYYGCPLGELIPPQRSRKPVLWSR